MTEGKSHSSFVVTFIVLVTLSSLCQLSLCDIDQLRRQTIEKGLVEIRKLSREQKIRREIMAIAIGSPVTYSSYYRCSNGKCVCDHYQLDFKMSGGYFPQCWHPAVPQGSWIQVSTESPKFWTDVILQGRGDYNQWVTKLMIAYSHNGLYWDYVDGGRHFQGVRDRTTKVRISFATPVYARVIRIIPLSWLRFPSLRFEAIYLDMS